MIPRTLLASAGIIGLGAAVGGLVGYKTTKDPLHRVNGALGGSILGALSAGLSGLSLMASKKYHDLGETTAWLGCGGVVLGAVALGAREIPSPAQASQVYALTTANSGETINVRVGDSVQIALPNTANSGTDWQYTAPPSSGLVYEGRTSATATGGILETDTWAAQAPGTYTLTASAAGATFTTTVVVSQ